MKNYDPRNCEGYQNTNHFKKHEFMRDLKEEMIDYPEWLSVDALYHYAPYEVIDFIDNAIESNSLHSYFRNGERKVRKNDFIYWCGEKKTEKSFAQPVY